MPMRDQALHQQEKTRLCKRSENLKRRVGNLADLIDLAAVSGSKAEHLAQAQQQMNKIHAELHEYFSTAAMAQ